MIPMQRFFAACLLAVVLIWSSGPLAAQTPVLQVYTEVRNNQELTINSAGETLVDNPATRLLAALMAEAGLQYQLRVYPWARIQQGLDNDPNVLAYPVTRTVSREQRWLWVGEIQPLRYYLYGRRDHAERLPRSLDQARELRVGTIQGDVIDSYLASKNFTRLVHMTDVSRAPLMLMRDRFELFAMGAHRIPEYAELHGFDIDSLIPAVPLSDISTALFFALSRNSAPELLARLSAAYQTIVADGTFTRIMQGQIALP
jgi:polar amino acid transport system substrate-binding protein